jgi:hypothetical protein
MPGTPVGIAAVMSERSNIIAWRRVGKTFVLIADFGSDFVVFHGELSFKVN